MNLQLEMFNEEQKKHVFEFQNIILKYNISEDDLYKLIKSILFLDDHYSNVFDKQLKSGN